MSSVNIFLVCNQIAYVFPIEMRGPSGFHAIQRAVYTEMCCRIEHLVKETLVVNPECRQISLEPLIFQDLKESVYCALPPLFLHSSSALCHVPTVIEKAAEFWRGYEISIEPQALKERVQLGGAPIYITRFIPFPKNTFINLPSYENKAF